MIKGNSETPHWSIWLGHLVRTGKINRGENAGRLEQLMEWDRGGPRPDWMRDGKAPRVSMVQPVPAEEEMR